MRDIVAEFGDDILGSDATIDRKKLGAIVFSDDKAMSVSLIGVRCIADNPHLTSLQLYDVVETGANRVASRAYQNRRSFEQNQRAAPKDGRWSTK